jgi:glycosyltransferase involved in cell wall biosynthesis
VERRYKRPVREGPFTILHVAPGYWPMLGGGELLSTRLSEGLARRGHRMHVVNAPPNHVTWVRRPAGFPEPAGKDGVVLESPPRWDGWERWDARLVRWPLPGRGELRQWLRAWRRRALTRHLVQRARELQADLLLLSSANRFLVRAVAGVVERVDLPLLAVTQAHLTDPRLKLDEIGPLWRRADALAVNTEYEGRALAERLGLDADAWVLTGCGTEPATVPAPWPREERVLYLGRIDPSKGVDELLAAMRQVWERRPAARLTLAGSRITGSEAIDAWVAALPPELRARVDCASDLTEPEKHALLARARVLVLPSHHESFGIVLVEAWAHATPVVAYDTPVSRCIVHPEVDGLLARPGDVGALAESIERLLEDATLAERLGKAGQVGFLAQHTWDHVGARYEQAARHALERHTLKRHTPTRHTPKSHEERA